jgi:hypothetical protein
MATDETENNREQSTVLLGDLYCVRMKLVQTEIQRSRIEETRDRSEIQTAARDSLEGVQCVSSYNQV